MSHEIHRVTDVETIAPFTLRVEFEDGTSQVIDFRPVLARGTLWPTSGSSVLRPGSN